MQDERNDKERKAAVSALKKFYRKKNRGKGGIMKLIIVPVAMLLIFSCIVSIAIDKSELIEKQAELTALQQKAAELEAENASYQSILDEEDERTYMERIAREKLGYAYPDERRFYDTTRS